ncbi:XRE family transcriptional regulator [Parabacteroides distasonis]|uniref:XRE family transcriptional regulator n=2 Tax=Parabacteroides distasonis TaxID=823 RepID=A0A3R5WA65_PARDI|nr:XRE family transcriptional regulator [Parabacteroides distasonis]RGR26854.1 XRE family transcriptional regulator [Parabacteroides distasonis]RHB88029.1 XRE family transcriptional regulator [Parabacteroides distasonis]RHD17851.1 XRE family transcriptional regulator [Parabacteroides distasonis]RHD74046.1 XRE family transcriptional regulator [Parabacteroides distasonis]
MFFASNCANIVRNFINMNVIDNIFKIMAQKGIKQRTLADAMGIDESQISVMKKGNRDLKISEIENIASCLGISITDLFTWPERYVPEQSAGEKVLTTPKVILQLELEDSDVKADVIKLAFGDRVLEIKNK